MSRGRRVPLPHEALAAHMPMLQVPAAPPVVVQAPPVVAVFVQRFAVHASVVQPLPSLQSAAAVHENVQSLSQPSPLMVFMSSHCSVPDTRPSPHTIATQAPPLQMTPEPHDAPVAREAA